MEGTGSSSNCSGTIAQSSRVNTRDSFNPTMLLRPDCSTSLGTSSISSTISPIAVTPSWELEVFSSSSIFSSIILFTPSLATLLILRLGDPTAALSISSDSNPSPSTILRTPCLRLETIIDGDASVFMTLTPGCSNVQGCGASFLASIARRARKVRLRVRHVVYDRISNTGRALCQMATVLGRVVVSEEKHLSTDMPRVLQDATRCWIRA
ncbi:hypothetical protein V1515DRAFT_593208 [Lipomyces mesembrius]